MSDQVNVGHYSLEISGDEVLVRDDSGAVVDTVDLDEVEGELTLPDGQTVDLASLFADGALDSFRTASGPANDNIGIASTGPAQFRAFVDVGDAGSQSGSAGALVGTSLSHDPSTGETQPQDDRNAARASFEWSRHDPSGQDQTIPGNPSGGSNDNRHQPDEDEAEEWTDDFDPPSDNGQPPAAHDEEAASSPPEEQQQVEDEDPENDEIFGPTDELQPTEETPPIDDPQPPEQVNATPTDISLDAAAIAENAAGAIIGTLTIVDADAGDTHTLVLSDDRFEIVGGQLKLKSGIWLDFEREPSVTVLVTATDSAGNQLSETFTFSVSDVNEAPTALSLEGHQVSENAPGAVIGTLTVVDPDAGDDQSFAVSDSRFEVMNGELKLKDGVSLDYEAEQSVSVTVTATDNGGHSVQNAFTIFVADVDETPAVVTDPSQALWTSQLGKGQTTLGSGDDDLYIDTKSFNSVHMGDGYDTVHAASNGLGFGHTQAVKLSDVEAIDTTGYGVNKVSLSINDVLDMTDSDNRLTIIGDKGDSVTLTSNGDNHWTIVGSNAEFTTYAYSDPATQAVVEISNQLTAQVS